MGTLSFAGYSCVLDEVPKLSMGLFWVRVSNNVLIAMAISGDLEQCPTTRPLIGCIEMRAAYPMSSDHFLPWSYSLAYDYSMEENDHKTAETWAKMGEILTCLASKASLLS